MVMTRRDLKALRERLQADRLELVEDIERRQRQIDEDGPVEPVRREAPPAMVYKTTDNGSAIDDSGGDGASGEAPPLFSDEEAMIDAGAELVREIRAEADQRVAELKERVASLEGQMQMLMTLLGGSDGAKAIGRRKLLKAPS